MSVILACLFLARRYHTTLASNPGCCLSNIIGDCLVTAIVVTGATVHPNVPHPETMIWPALHHIFLICVALLAPEVMVVCAFSQWLGAVMIKETINSTRPAYSMYYCVCPQALVDQMFIGEPWTMSHAHFLQMGGFQLNYIMGDHFSTWHPSKTNEEGIVQESVLNLCQLQYLLEERLIRFPDTPASEIRHKSKGELMAGLALLRITFFFLQLIIRARQQLLISDIERLTAALIGLNGIMYLFWWSKPFAASTRIAIRTTELTAQVVKARGKDMINEEETEGSGENMKEEPCLFKYGV